MQQHATLSSLGVLASVFAAATPMLALGEEFTGELSRTWRNADGAYRFDAKLLRRSGDIVDLQRNDGMVLRLPIELLSADDQAYLDPTDAAKFELQGIGRISAPDGYRWSLAANRSTEAGPMIVYACQGPEGIAGGMTITVSPQVAIGDGVRASHLKGHWNGLLEGVQGAGIKPSAATQPDLTGTIPDRVEYQVSGLNSDQQPILVRGLTLFQDNRTLLFQIIEPDNVAPTRFYEIMETFRPISQQAQH